MPDVSGKRILIVGDSLSASSAAPGGILAARLRGAGATVTVDAIVGRSARSFYAAADAAARVTAAWDVRPDLVIVSLGTNDIVVGAATDQASMQRLHDDLEKGGAQVWAFGPPAFAAGHRLEAGEPQVVSMMRGVFGDRFIDTRPLSSDLVGTNQRTADGIHFPASSAKVLGERMAQRFLDAGAGGLPIGWGILAASVIGYLLLR